MKRFPARIPGSIAGYMCLLWLYLCTFPVFANVKSVAAFHLPESAVYTHIEIFYPAFISLQAPSSQYEAALSGESTGITDPIKILLQGLYYGFLIVMALYHLLLYFFIRDKNKLFLYYALYISGLGLFVGIYSGWGGLIQLMPLYSPVCTGIFLAGASYFIRELLETSKYSFLSDRILQKIPFGAIILILLGFINYLHIATVAGILFTILFTGAALRGIYHAWKNQIFPAKYLLIYWPALLMGVLTVQFENFGWVFTFEYAFILYSLQVVSLVDIVLLAVLLARQINQMQAKHEQIQKEVTQAEQSQRFKDQFLANTSHEIRTPMNAIIGFTRLLEQSALASYQRDYVRYIKDSANNLLVIINDILDFSKIESGKIIFERVHISLHAICQTLIETLRFKMEEKNLHVSYYIDEKIPHTFLGDPVRLNQILLNLFSNAIKFTEEGSVHLKAQLLHRTESQIRVLFEVTDTGIGIAEDKLHLIFESFSQANDHTTRKYGGTGLGLTIVKQLVELQGGQIFVKSRINEGSTFSVIMTFDTGNLNDHANARNYATSGTIPVNLSILLLEDNPINQILAVNTLQKWMPSIQIDIANNGREGIEKLQAKEYHLMLVDIQMPVMDGYETTRFIRENMPFPKNNIPIIALTAGALKADEEQALAAGMNDFISKPFDAEVLFEKIRLLQKGRDMQMVSGNKFEIAHVEKAGLGDPEFMVQLMDMFLEKTPEALKQMMENAEDNNWKQVGFIAHRIKSVFVCMGLTHLQQELLHIEELAVNQANVAQIPSMINQLETGCNEAFIQIAEERNKLVNNNS